MRLLINGVTMKQFVLGDCHGCYKALVQCLERSKFNKKEDTLIVLGDVCDGFPDVRQCVDELLSIKNMIYIMGNHDDFFTDYIKTGIAQPIWTTQGGTATLESYKEGLPESHRKLFFTSPYKYFDDFRNQFYVHGGFSSNLELSNNTPDIMMWDRTLYQNAFKYVVKHPFKELKILNFKDIFVGHTNTGTPEPVHVGNVWNLDQGAGWNGWLTIMNVDTYEFWQSDNVIDLYGEYDGRFKQYLNS